MGVCFNVIFCSCVPVLSCAFFLCFWGFYCFSLIVTEQNRKAALVSVPLLSPFYPFKAPKPLPILIPSNLSS